MKTHDKHTRNSCFRLVLYSCFILVVSTATFAAQTDQRQVSFSQVIGSSGDHPNPHNPFWISYRRLGFVTEVEQSGRGEVKVWAIDLRTRHMTELLQRSVWDVTFLAKLNQLSFVSIGTSGENPGSTLFTKPLTQGKEVEYHFDLISVFHPSWSPDGRQVVFANASYLSQLVMADVTSSKTQALSLGYGKEVAGADMPDWSPSGGEIVYVGWDKTSQLEGGDTFRREVTFPDLICVQ
jgi:hypothetical protein